MKVLIACEESYSLSTYGGTVGIIQARGNPGGKKIT